MLPALEKTFYTIEFDSKSRADSEGNSIMEFGYFMSGDVKHYERSIYTALDLFGDVGGLFEALKVLASIIMFVAQIIIKGGP